MLDQDMNVADDQITDLLSPAGSLEPEHPRIKYPKVERDERESYIMHGVKIADPYRHLEDSSREDTRIFIEEQNSLYQSFMSNSKSRSLIKDQLKKYSNYPKIQVPMKKGSRYFYWEANWIQNHSILYVKEALDGESRVLLDPNRLHKDGSISVLSYGISNKGQYLGYGTCENGSDWITIKIRDVNCGHDLSDTLRYAKLTSILWTKDSKGFFYQRYPVPLQGYGQPVGTETGLNSFMKVYYHELGKFQEDDIVIVEFPNNPTWTINIELSDDGDYLIVHASGVIRERQLYAVSLLNGIKKGLELLPLMDKNRGEHWYLANDDTKFYFVTNVGAPNCQIVSFDIKNSGRSNWTVVVPENPKNTIDWTLVVNENKLVICYIENVKSKIEIRDLKNGSIIQQLPIKMGAASGFYGRRMDDEMFIKIESYIDPGTVYKVDFKPNGKIEMNVFRDVVMKSPDLSNLEMTQLSYSSDDGSNIPLYLIHRKDMVLDANRPCLLTAYGGYGINKLPTYTVPYLLFAQDFKGVVAIASIRGGGEFGARWWNEGRLLNKQNGFDDFIAGAQFLIHNKYTRREKLAIQGASNGGLLIAAVVNQQPQLFGAAIPQVAILDMLRFQHFTVGHLWRGEYGNSEEDETHFNYLKSYSPLHNIRLPIIESIQYPAILVSTAENDDRVVPSHSYKYVAELQYTIGSSPRQTNPLITRIDPKSGHGFGKPYSKRIEETADIYAFLEQTLNYDFQA